MLAFKAGVVQQFPAQQRCLDGFVDTSLKFPQNYDGTIPSN